MPARRRIYSEGILVGYRWFDAKKIEPQFPFGFGLSYTTFASSPISTCQRHARRPGARPAASARSHASQPRSPTRARATASEAVQVYVEQAKPSLASSAAGTEGIRQSETRKGGGKPTLIDPAGRYRLFAYFDPAQARLDRRGGRVHDPRRRLLAQFAAEGDVQVGGEDNGQGRAVI